MRLSVRTQYLKLRPGAAQSCAPLEAPRVGQHSGLGAAPVFVVGCPRSGTTLLHHMILSSGGFALFPVESRAFALFGAKFPDLASFNSRKSLLEFFVRTEIFARSGLARDDIEPRVLRDCKNIGDFLSI